MTSNIRLNENKLNKMKYDILDLEEKNSKTSEKNNKEMVNKIRGIIMARSRRKEF